MILITGGAGYIGSHAVIEFITAGYEVLVLDNFSNSSIESVNRLKMILNQDVNFIEGDICDSQLLKNIFQQYPITSVVHFAGLKVVNDSVTNPLSYYHNNVYGSLVLLEAMKEANVKTIVFSSTANVYGNPQKMPIREDFAVSPFSPYGVTKLVVENMLRDVFNSENGWRIVALRYFNPTGAHDSGLIGEDPNGIPSNLMPYIAQVASGKMSHLNVFGDDYPTVDGTGVRDFIHVVDLVKAHIKAIEFLEKNETAFEVVNIGTGTGYSVLQMVKAFEQASGQSVPYQIAPRRGNDIATSYTDPSYAKAILNWQAEFGLQRMCVDLWRWQSQNPNGYNT